MKNKTCKLRQAYPKNNWFDNEWKQIKNELYTIDPLCSGNEQYFSKCREYKKLAQKKKDNFIGKCSLIFKIVLRPQKCGRYLKITQILNHKHFQ